MAGDFDWLTEGHGDMGQDILLLGLQVMGYRVSKEGNCQGLTGRVADIGT